MKKTMTIFCGILVSAMVLIGCDMTSVDKIKEPIKKVYLVIDKLIPVLNELGNTPNIPENIKQNLTIAVNGLTIVETTLNYAAKILGIDLSNNVVAKAENANKLSDLQNAITELDNLNKTNK